MGHAAQQSGPSGYAGETPQPAPRPAPPGGNWVLAAVAVGGYTTGLGNNVVNAILPLIAQSFGSTLALTEWVLLTYQLTVVCLLLFIGRLADIIGPRRIFLTGFAVLAVASTLCAQAPTMAWLIAARFAQGVGAAMLMATSPGILVSAVPPEKRGRAMGILSAAVYLGLTTGPGVGGMVAQVWDWRWAFGLNIPVAMVALTLAAVVVPRDQRGGPRVPLDFIGGALFLFGLGGTLLGLSHGQQWGWTSPLVLSSLGLGVLLLPLFVWWQARAPHPMLDLTLFRSRIFSAGAVSAVANYMCQAALGLLTPFYLIMARGLNPGQAGLLLMSMPIVMAVTAPLSGTLSDRIGARVPATLGMLLLAAGLALLGTLGADNPPEEVIWPLALCGLGSGLFTSPNNSALMGAAPPQRRGIAGGVMAAARLVGFVLGVATSGAALAIALAARGELQPGAGAVTVAALADAYRVMVVPALLGALTSSARGTEDRASDQDAVALKHA